MDQIKEDPKAAARTLLYFRPAAFLIWLLVIAEVAWPSSVRAGLAVYAIANAPFVIGGAYLGLQMMRGVPGSPQRAKNLLWVVFLLLAIEFYTLGLALTGSHLVESGYQKAGWDFLVAAVLYLEAFFMLPPSEQRNLW